MKFLGLLFTVSIFLIGCEKDHTKIEICYAGIVNNEMYYFDFIPDSFVTCPAASLDLNKDGEYDIELWNFYMSSPNGYESRSGITICDSTFQFIITSDSISPKILYYNDTIDENKLWSNKPKVPNDYFLLTKDYWVGPYTSKYTYWLWETGYIGIRNEFPKNRYKYGWMKINVGQGIIIIYDIGYMR